MIDKFSKHDFEAALTSARGVWESLGMMDGEYSYAIPVSETNKRILVRSSVGRSGVSADTGEDSIRLWLQYSYKGRWAPMKKIGKWVTRVPGWEDRMADMIDKLWDLAVEDTNNHRAKYAKKNSTPSVAEIESRADAPRCVQCGTPMVVKHGKFGKFFACPGFPECKYTTPYFERPAEIVELPEEAQTDAVPQKFEFSEEQLAIFDYISEESGHLVVEAKAGSGKTFTLKHAALKIDNSKSVLAVAFNRHIADALREAMKEHPRVSVSTLHSKGYSDIGVAFGRKPRVDDKKLYTILREFVLRDMPPKSARRKAIDANSSLVVKMVNLLKDTLKPPTRESLNYLTERFGVTPEGISFNQFYAVVKLLFWLSLRYMETVDYGDMVYLPASGIVATSSKYDYVLGDEAQDYNAGQIELVMRSVKHGGRVIVFGDRYQSIYGFRGADTDAIPNIIHRLQAETLPLNTCYRCSRNIISEAQKFVPEIRAAAWAKPGVVTRAGEVDILDLIRAGDLVLCRVNAPLVPLCYLLLRMGMPAIIRGRDIGESLKRLFKKISDDYGVRTTEGLLEAVAKYRDKEMARLAAADRGSQAQAVQDQADTLIELAMDVDHPSEVVGKINALFTDTPADGFVVLSTVHKAKGDEANNVFILRPDLLPHPLAVKEWEQAQELNLQYVAVTRAKEYLCFVDPSGVR